MKNWLILSKTKKLFGEIFCSIQYIPKFLSNIDKTIILALSLIIIIAGSFLWHNHWVKITREVPAYGGTLNEGIIGTPKDLEKHLGRLTGAGLTRLQQDGSVQGDLAASWQILDSGKTYEFKLRDGINAQDLVDQIKNQNIWSDIAISATANNLIDFKFKQPFSPFLYISTQPVFNNGPYSITKEEKNQVTLAARDDYWQGKPNITKIIVHFYANQDTLIKAAERHEIMGYLKTDQNEWQDSNSTVLSFSLPRQLLLFFNLKNNDLKNKTLRQTIRDNKSADKEYNFTLVTNDNAKNLQIAQGIKDQWATMKINITIQKYDNVTLQKDIIPNRKYDILLYSLDYGPDPDPYPFWHSSQIGTSGTNLSNYSNPQADKLLEDARQNFDFKTRDADYVKFNQILADDVPFIKISQDVCIYSLSKDVKGVDKIYGFSETDRFLNVNQWYIKSKRVKI